MKRGLGWWAGVVVVLLGLAVGLEGDRVRGQSTQPTTEPTKAEVAEHYSKEKKIERLVALVTSEYERVLKSKDWMNRGMALVCLSRLPGKEATGMILGVLQKDSTSIVRMIAWHCIAARSQALTEEEYKAFCAATWEMVDKNMFPGEMRVGLLWWLQYQPADARGRKLWMKIFDETNSQKWYFKSGGAGEDLTATFSYEGNDLPVIRGLEKVLKRWHDGELMGKMVQRIGNLDDILRAEMIIQSCASSPRPQKTDTTWREGSDVMVKKAMEEYGKWWKGEQGNWKGTAVEGEDWRKLRSPYVPELVCMTQAEIDPDDPSWRKDLELGNPNIRSVNVALVVDATASMTAPIIRMRVDLRRLMTALSMISLEPRVSVTFYRDYTDDFLARTVMPLMGPDRIEAGIREVEKMTAKGGGDEPEAVLAGLRECVAKSGWPTVADAKKIIIIIGDAPPHDKKQYPAEKEAYAHEREETVKLAKELAGKGFRIYTEKAVTGWEALDLGAFDEIAEAGNGKSAVVTFPGVQPRAGKSGKAEWAMAAWNASKRAGEGEIQDPYTEMMAGILTELISPQFKPRVEPMVKMLLAGLSVNSRKETQPPWPKVEAGGSGRSNPQGK